jgi:hypothetical protein
MLPRFPQIISDSARARALHDTVSVRADTLGAPPLPGGVQAVVRAVFSAPTWLWLTLMSIGGIIAAIVLWQAWTRRVALWTWFRTRPRGVTIAIFGTVGFLVLASAGFGMVSWNYMQHDNRFCSSCHVMTPAFQAMKTSTVHDSLSCHDCHQQSIFASSWQLFVWLKDRPEKIEKHAIVPNGTCQKCHSGTNEKWQRVLRTAGHRLHLESDSSALDSVQCVTCHAQEVHRFMPADRTCGQSGCHKPEDTHIRIGAMAAQTSLHCVTCHQFTAELPQLAGLDSVRNTLRPGSHQCFSCHQMRERVADFNIAKDPHGGQCGMCHNPHTQDRPQEAIKQCTSAGCHAGWRDVAFHAGAIHRGVALNATQCKTCHTPHAARVDAADCQGCHADVARRIPGMRRLNQGFDTTRALRHSSIEYRIPETGYRQAPDTSVVSGIRHPVSALEKSSAKHGPAPPPPDSFDHRRHTAVACLTCHAVQSSSRLTFEAPRGCQICHHTAPNANRCETCHTASEIAPPHAAVVTVAVRGQAPRPRGVGFRHERHASLACATCHGTGVSRAPADSIRTCAACHDDHHQAARECSTCHTGNDAAMRSAHAPPANAHAACTACHQSATVARLIPDRQLCLTCHATQRDHQPGRECSTCHFLQDPAAYRRHLLQES